ncbi:DUF262 domain-containing protein [Apilactobacillus kunkeei]|uniref:DUF262 domain-containing protein n=1 Tax=Apilactobacillus kunkeei TaxID=148814 RepID=UPI0015E85C00|nr:DUF262 domain-containing protein [Apilactobacillus kunkeei]
MANTKSEQKNIKEYFYENNCFHIPGFQRNYAWEKGNIYDLVEDLFSLMDDSENRNEHFFGQIITYRENDNIEIIDGQQRMTTIFIFLGVIKQILLDEKKELEKSDNTEGLISRINEVVVELNSLVLQKQKGFDNDDKKIKLQLQEDFHGNDSQKSLNKVLGFDDDKQIEKKHNHIEDNFLYLKSQINERVKKNSNSIKGKLQLLVNIKDTILEKFSIVVIDAENRGNAFIIFQTINIRGKELTSADIIKSHIVSFDKSEGNEFLLKWSDIYDTLGKDDSNIANFIKDYVWARFSSPGDRELYREVSKIIKTKEEANQFLDDLMELKDLYSSLIEGNNKTFVSRIRKQYCIMESDNTDAIDNITEILFSLNRMGEKLHFPIILAMKNNKLSLNTILLILSKVYKTIVRNNIIVGKPNNKLTKKIAIVSRNIWKARTASDLDTENILSGFNDVVFPDKQVFDSFIHLKRKGGKKGTQYGTLTVLLHSIYNSLGLLNDREINYYSNDFENNNYKLVHLTSDDSSEEVDDIGLVSEWTYVEKSILDDEHIDYDNKISLNREERIKVLIRSDIKANKIIAEELESGGNVWNDKKISERQNVFANEAIQIWN